MDYIDLTEKQAQIYDFLKNEIRDKGYPPSVREICEAVNLKSTSSVHANLATLEKKGYIRRDPSKSRTIEIVDDDFYGFRREVVDIPVVGRVAAGEPILAEQNIESLFPLPAEYIPKSKDVFMLTVKGESMINVGIYDGDLLLVAEQKTARNGEIVVCLVEDSATVKRFYKEDGHYRLQPENDTMDPIIVDHVEVIGKVIGLFRNLQ